MFALVDCNNFYCSCERVFNPALRTSPVVVLSNNDGCIIARSNEAKAMGIAMGTPFYQVKDMLERNKVAVFSSKRSESWVRKMLTISGVRTWRELHGESCIDIEELPQKKSICTSRSFADEGLSELCHLEEAVANFASACSRKLKQQHSCCGAVTVFAYTSRFRTDVPRRAINHTSVMTVPTNDLRELVSTALDALRSQWPADTCRFKKAGVIVWDICPDTAVQTYLFDKVDRAKQARLAAAIDCINRKNGYGMVKIAVQGTGNDWHLKHEHASQRYTTDLNEIIKVKA